MNLKDAKYITNLWLDARYEVKEVVVDDSVLEAAWGKTNNSRTSSR